MNFQLADHTDPISHSSSFRAAVKTWDNHLLYGHKERGSASKKWEFMQKSGSHYALYLCMTWSISMSEGGDIFPFYLVTQEW